MAETFGDERIGFLTLTVGDPVAGGRFRNLRDRKEAQRRFHSLLTHEISKRFACGVTVTERHKNGGIHFHLAVACGEDIHGQIDFDACFPPKDDKGKPRYAPDYSTANAAIKREWAFWRRTAKKYGFGRHQLQPMKSNGEALGRYLGKYLSKDWDARLPEDKGARCVRYFGHWSKETNRKGERKKAPPNKARFGWLTTRARIWREMLKQVVTVLNYNGAELTEENIKDKLGHRWAWRMGKLVKAVAFVEGEWQAPEVRKAIAEHNAAVQVSWLAGGGDPGRKCWWHVTEITLDHLRPSPEWEKQVKELELAKECEAIIKKGLRTLAKDRWQQEEKMRMLQEVAELFKTDWPKPKILPPKESG
jgi:hypothetical protein